MSMEPAFSDVDAFFSHLRAVKASGDKETLKILKATSFLVLYNVIEATTRLCLEEIAEALRRDNLPLTSVSERISSLHVDHNVLRPIRDGAREHAVGYVLDTALLAAKGECLAVSRKSLRLNGNVDAAKVRSLASVFGFTPPSDGSCLKEVKDKRNGLAHGNFRFRECGSEYVLSDLERYRRDTVKYLKGTLRSVESYIQARRYDLEVRLSEVRGLGSKKVKLLVSHFGTALAVFSASTEQLTEVDGIGEHTAQAITTAAKDIRVSRKRTRG